MTPVSIAKTVMQVASLAVDYGPGGMHTVKIEYALFTPQGALIARGHLPANALSTETVNTLKALLAGAEADTVKYLGASLAETLPPPAEPPTPAGSVDEEEKPIGDAFRPGSV